MPYSPAIMLLVSIFTQVSWRPGSYKNLHMNVYGSFTHNCQKLEITKMFLNRIKQWYIHTMEYYSLINMIYQGMMRHRNLKCILLSERNQSKKVTYYIIPIIKLWRQYKTSGLLVWRWRVERKWGEGGIGGPRGFLGQWNHSVWNYNSRYMTFGICQNPQYYSTHSEP